MRLTRQNLNQLISSYLNEVTRLDSKLTQGFFDAMMRSNFWKQPHSVDDVDLVTETELSTPAIEALMDALNNEASTQNSDLYFLLHVTGDDAYALGPADRYGNYPNNWLMRGQMQGYQTGKYVIVLEFRPLSNDFNMADLNPAELVKKISRTINHEIVHSRQLKKQAQSKSLPADQAFDEMIKDPRQYSKSGKRSDYLSRHIEIDAYAYEAAEELLDMYTKEEALNQLRFATPKSPGVLSDYVEALSGQREDLHNFMSKVYTHIQSK